jgi:hypothetical protein
MFVEMLHKSLRNMSSRCRSSCQLQVVLDSTHSVAHQIYRTLNMPPVRAHHLHDHRGVAQRHHRRSHLLPVHCEQALHELSHGSPEHVDDRAGNGAQPCGCEESNEWECRPRRYRLAHGEERAGSDVANSGLDCGGGGICYDTLQAEADSLKDERDDDGCESGGHDGGPSNNHISPMVINPRFYAHTGGERGCRCVEPLADDSRISFKIF